MAFNFGILKNVEEFSEWGIKSGKHFYKICNVLSLLIFFQE